MRQYRACLAIPACRTELQQTAQSAPARRNSSRQCEPQILSCFLDNCNSRSVQRMSCRSVLRCEETFSKSFQNSFANAGSDSEQLHLRNNATAICSDLRTTVHRAHHCSSTPCCTSSLHSHVRFHKTIPTSDRSTTAVASGRTSATPPQNEPLHIANRWLKTFVF